MKPIVKTSILVIFAAIVVGAFVFQVNNKNLFKGQIFSSPESEEESETTEDEKKSLPDLTGEISARMPENDEEDIIVTATIENRGQGEIRNGENFKYAIYINDKEVFVNTDSYTKMSPGDKFSFTYPIPRSIYLYPDSGVIELRIDTENNVQEEDETNNLAEAEYNISS